MKNMPGEVKLQKAFEMTEHVRSIMRAGLREQYPDVTEDELQAIYVDRLLSYHGWSLEKIRHCQLTEYGS